MYPSALPRPTPGRPSPPVRRLGTHRVPFRELMAYKAATDARRRAALDELAALDQELGLE